METKDSGNIHFRMFFIFPLKNVQKCGFHCH